MRTDVIGGLVFWDPERPVTLEHLLAMAGGVGDVHPAVRDSIGLFSAGRSEDVWGTDRVWAVVDTDVTNLRELQDLAGTGEGGAALFAALYAREGAGFVRRLHGAFAIALWDRRERVLFLAVDRFGIKRLHYVTGPGRIAFASRASALLAAPGVEARPDLTQIYNYLNFGFVPAPGSVLTDVCRVPPGFVLTAQDGRARIEPYWDMAYPERRMRRRDAAGTLFQLTEEAVAHTLHGIDPKEAGAFLSGGTDSSTVVGMLARVTGERPNAFSIGFREERYDELGYARLAARHFGAAHYTQVVTPEEALGALPRLVETYDEPFGNNSAIGTFFCAQLARQCGVRHLLAGDGGDEIFGGNERYRTDRIFGLYQRVPRVLRQGLLEPALRSLPDGDAGLLGRARRYVRRANIPMPRRLYSYGFFFAQERETFLAPDFLSAIDAEAPYSVLQSHYDRARATADLNRILYLDLKLTIGDNDLLKVMRTADLAGVTVRFPLLDPPLVEFTGTLPADHKVRGLEKRHLFKRAFRPLLPREILAKHKHGFGVPTSDWLKTHAGFRALAQDALLSSLARQRGYFRPEGVEELFRRHAADTTPFYGDILWTVLMLELWHRRHLDGGGVQ